MRLFKNILTATALVLMVAGLSSCYFRFSDDAKKQFKYDMRYRMHTAEGEVDTVAYTPGEFHSVRCKGGIDDVMIVQTENEFKVETISYEMMTDSIQVTNENGVLTVGFTDKTARIFGPTQVRIYAPALTSISSTSSNIRISGYHGDSLLIETIGSGLIKAFNLEISGKLTIIGTGSSDHELKHITASEMVIDKKGSGDGVYSDLNVGTLSVTSTGSGDAILSGKADSVTISKAGSGDIDASELKAKHVKTQESGSGDLTINEKATK